MKSAKKCPACGMATVSTRRTKAVRIGRTRNLECFNCGHTWKTVEMLTDTLHRVLNGDTATLADLWRVIKPVQLELEGKP